MNTGFADTLSYFCNPTPTGLQRISCFGQTSHFCPSQTPEGEGAWKETSQ